MTVQTCFFNAVGPAWRRDPGTACSISSRVQGSAQIHPNDQVSLRYQVIVDLYRGKDRLSSCDKRVHLIFSFYARSGDLIKIQQLNFKQAGEHIEILSLPPSTAQKVSRVVV